jgi:hypothetical protein
MFARNLRKPRAADPELARKSLAFLGILYLLGYVGFGNEQGLILVKKTFNSGRLIQLLVLRLGFLQNGGEAVETRQSRRATGAPWCGGTVWTFGWEAMHRVALDAVAVHSAARVGIATVELFGGLLNRCCWPRRAIKLPRKRSQTKANHRETD